MALYYIVLNNTSSGTMVAQPTSYPSVKGSTSATPGTGGERKQQKKCQ
jgi:hypothetical protein